MKRVKSIFAFLLITLSINTLYAYNDSDIDSVTELYIASFNRAPDSAGLQYWLDEMENNHWTTQMVAQSMFMQPEANELYDDNDLDNFINSVYKNLLNREPDSAGFDYWKRELSSHNIPKEEFLLAIINGAKAQGDDSDDTKVLKHKVEVAKYFAIEKGLNDAKLAKEIISQIDSSDESVERVKSEIDSFSKNNSFSDEILNATLQIQYIDGSPISVDKDETPYYYISDDGDIVFTSDNDDRLKRVELRVIQEWGLDDFDKITIRGSLKLDISNDTNEVTFMQLHHKSRGAKPFVRLVWRREKDGFKNSIWAVVRKNEDSSGDISDWYYLGTYPTGEFISAKISVIEGSRLSISANNKNIEIDIPPYWRELEYDKQRFYFKAGLYFSGDNEYPNATLIYRSLLITDFTHIK